MAGKHNKAWMPTQGREANVNGRLVRLEWAREVAAATAGVVLVDAVGVVLGVAGFEVAQRAAWVLWHAVPL